MTCNEWMYAPCCCSYRRLQVVRKVPDHVIMCNMSQWHHHEGAWQDLSREPHGCTGLEEVFNNIDAPPDTFYVHANDTGEGEVSKQCKSLGKILLRSASSIASSQDAVASGLRDAAFLKTKPERKSSSDVVLSIVTALQGVAVAFLMLFVDADARALRMLDWHRSLTARWQGLPQPPPVQAEDVNKAEMARLRASLLVVAICMSLYVQVCSRDWLRSCCGGQDGVFHPSGENEHRVGIWSRCFYALLHRVAGCTACHVRLLSAF